VLLRLAQTHYSEKTARHTELDNFWRVAHQRAPHDPLDDESALLLAQRYSDSFETYAYFTDLRALEAADFRQFFAAVDRIRTQAPLDGNLRLGQLHSLVEWICLFSRLHLIDDREAAKLFAMYAIASRGGERRGLHDRGAGFGAGDPGSLQAFAGADNGG